MIITGDGPFGVRHTVTIDDVVVRERRFYDRVERDRAFEHDRMANEFTDIEISWFDEWRH